MKEASRAVHRALAGACAGDVVNDKAVIAGVDLLPTLAAIGKQNCPTMNPTAKTSALARWTLHAWQAAAVGIRPQRHEFQVSRQRRRSESATGNARDGKFKVLLNSDGSQLELYDLAADPNEKSNVAKDHAQVADSFRDYLLDWKRSCRSLSRRPVSSYWRWGMSLGASTCRFWRKITLALSPPRFSTALGTLANVLPVMFRSLVFPARCRRPTDRSPCASRPLRRCSYRRTCCR